MKRHLISFVIAILSLAFMLGAIPTPLQAANAESPVPTGTQMIWCGLINGSNFNFSDSCTKNTGNGNGSGSGSSQSKAYAALGDSVAAGLGLPLAGGADSTAVACGRSPEGYPTMVANDLSLPLTNASCSGTTVGDLLTPETINGVEQPPQLDAAFASGTPKYISITSGANDVEWSYFLRECYLTNCDTTTNTIAVDALLVGLQAKLFTALHSIQSRSNGTPPITAVTGYYRPVSEACVQASNGRLSEANLQWLLEANTALNQTIRQTAADFSFVHFVPIDFSGHDACSADPWVQSETDAAPFHPTAEGQAVIAKAVEASLVQ